MPEKQRGPKVVPPTDPRVKGRDTCRVPAAPAQPVPSQSDSDLTEWDFDIPRDNRFHDPFAWQDKPAAPSPVLTQPSAEDIKEVWEYLRCHERSYKAKRYAGKSWAYKMIEAIKEIEDQSDGG